MRNRNFNTNKVFLFVGIICLLFIVSSWENRVAFKPLETTTAYFVIPASEGINSIGDFFVAQIAHIRSLENMIKENNQLKEQLAEMTYQNKILQLDKFELDRLRQLYDLDKTYFEYPKIGARVIGKDPGDWYNVFMIDKGTQDGIAVNMTVMAGNGLVGYIYEVGPNYAMVRSIIDDNSFVSGKILRSEDICGVQGSRVYAEKGLSKVEFIGVEQQVMKGDEIVTSQLSDIYPPGILVGKITEVSVDLSGLTKTGTLEPEVDFKHLNEVLVINQIWKEDMND